MAIDDEDSIVQSTPGRYRAAADFTVLEASAEVTPEQAVIDAWRRLEYELNIASDRIVVGQPHGWPQVVRNLETWDKWAIIYPAVLELRQFRDYAARSHRPLSRSDADRYVSVAEDLVAILRDSFPPETGSASVSTPT